MTSDTVQILIFAASEDSFDGWARVKILEGELVARGITIQFVNRLSSNLEALTLVAKHRIVKSPAVIVMRKTKLIARYVGVPSADQVMAWIEEA